MNTAIISLGSNVVGRHEILSRAAAAIVEMTVTISGFYEDSTGYLNAVAVVDTELSHDELRSRFKLMEQAEGRTPASKATGLIPLDIDIVIFNGEILRPYDFDQPYFRRGLEMAGVRGF